MSWQQELRKTPFDAKTEIMESWKDLPSRERSHNQMIKLLEDDLDPQIKHRIHKLKKNRFTLPVDNALHNRLRTLSGGEEELKTRMKLLYGLSNFDFKKTTGRPMLINNLPSQTAGTIEYIFEVM